MATGSSRARRHPIHSLLAHRISRLWRSSRYSAAKLQDVHVRLGQLQQSSETLAATRTGGAPAFYADLEQLELAATARPPYMHTARLFQLTAWKRDGP